MRLGQADSAERRAARATAAPRRLIAAFLGAALLALAAAAPASAETTHKYLGAIPLTGITSPMPAGVDDDGNIIVWDDSAKEVVKVDPDGNPVNFSALGTNVLDGKGGSDCPNTPADCDRVQTNGFNVGVPSYQTPDTAVAVDTSGGVANGYIYVANTTVSGGEVDVFASSGRFLGIINTFNAFPVAAPGAKACTISLSPNGTLFIGHAQCGGGAFPSHTDVYAPIDANPAHDRFIGQIRSAWGFDFTSTDLQYSLGDDDYIYGHGQRGGDYSFWRKWPKSELGRPSGSSVPIDFSPDQSRSGNDSGPFGDGGVDYDICNCVRSYGAIDPANHDVYLIGGAAGNIEQWTIDNQKVGPDFGVGTYNDSGEFYAATRMMTFDRSGGPNDGDIYIEGSDQQSIAVYSPPVIIPDYSYGSVTPGHKSAHIEATVGEAGGGPITDCHVEYGTTKNYGAQMPCSGTGDVSVDLTGLFTETDYHYRIMVSNANGTNPGADQTFHTLAVLGVETDPATDIDRTSATLHGKLNPDGMDTTYHFEYGIDTQYHQRTPDVDVGDGSGQITVPPVEIDSLQSGRTYHYRLVADNSLGTTYGPDRTLTVASSPSISGVHTTDVTDTSAVLHARINPYGSDTTYHFEYGTTPDYGQSVPIPDEDIGAGSADQDVSQAISGLQSGVTYHFRVVAENDWGMSASGDSTFSFFPPNCPNSHIRQQTKSNYLPDCRAYELVSPSSAGAVTLLPGAVNTKPGLFLNIMTQPLIHPGPPNPRAEATNPPRFAYFGGMGNVTGTSPPNSIVDRYVATRTTSGWVTTYPGLKGSETVMQARPECNITLDTCLDYNGGDLLGSGQFPSPTPYVWDVSGESKGRWPTNLKVVPNIDAYINAQQLTGDEHPSPDFSHYAFTSRDVVFTAGGVSGAPGSAYDNDIKNRTVAVISQLPNGDPIPRDSGNQKEYIKLPAISDDGSHILMSTVAPGGNTHLYMRVGGGDGVTYPIPPQGQGVHFVAMSRDGSTVVFTSADQLTGDDSDSSVDMYVWNESTNSITRVSQGNGNGNSDSCNTSWTSACNVAPITPQRPDLDNVIAPGNGDPYFYSPEQLDPSNPGVLNERNLYVYRNGKAQYVATFTGNTQVDRIQISPDDSHVGILTAAQLTGYDNDGWRQMYTYDPATGIIRCASCLPSGEPPATLHPNPPASTLGNDVGDVEASESGPFMSNDGRVAFTTSDALVPQDTNGLMDVYEFVDSRPQLISSGTGDRDVFPGNAFYGAFYVGLEAFGANGVDLYFSTYDTLVPQDHNGNFIKFYDARTDGGFPPPPPDLPCVAADECHGVGNPTPAEPQIGSGARLGAGGNQQAAPRKKRAHRKAKRHRKRHAARHHRKRGHRGRRGRGGRHGRKGHAHHRRGRGHASHRGNRHG